MGLKENQTPELRWLWKCVGQAGPGEADPIARISFPGPELTMATSLFVYNFHTFIFKTGKR